MSQAEINQRFYRNFQQQSTELHEEIEQIDSYSFIAGEQQDAIDHANFGLTQLSNKVTDAIPFVPAYDQRTYQQAIRVLEDKLQEARNKAAPKKRFQFKTTQKNSSANPLSDAAELAKEQGLKAPVSGQSFLSSNESSMATTPALFNTPPGETNSKDTLSDLPSFSKNYNEEMDRPGARVRKPSFTQAPSVNITGHNGLHIILPSSASRATSSGSITKLNRCIVDMSVPTTNGAPFAGLALQDIQQSLIIAGHVAGAVHITGVKNSIIVVAARQVRMHECRDVDIYLHCASRPIIEYCSNVRFSPIPECYNTTRENIVPNQWDQVDDFNWLKAGHSPNWTLVPDDEILEESVWTKVVPGGPNFGLADILKKVRLPPH
ncbi:hypothetical protein LZ554_003831 [Drepanopeziza brunnea f. sp. 'monogermtubi']|nr:hypothetical protein LZ554_003831 [Drepanopeziza brunnea f. sp. 'monogermtubi']